MGIFDINKKKGWFKKVKKRYVLQKVYRFNLFKRCGLTEKIERCVDGYSGISYYSRDEVYQLLRGLELTSFPKAFWKAREISRRKDSTWFFGYDKRIKDI